MRMFERDKDELRAFGIAIETVPLDEEETTGYKLDNKSFYLPYLSLSTPDGRSATQPRKIGRQGYRSLPSLEFQPDELEVIRQAAERVRSLGDPELAEDAASAIRKLAFDLPLPPADEPASTLSAMMSVRGFPRDSAEYSVLQLSPARTMPAREIFELLNDALTRRKRVSFDYRGMGSDTITQRTVEPYGLFFLSSHWYVVGNDHEKAELRNFRLNRIDNPRVNISRSQSRDYDIPVEFKLREHARSKQAWELGDANNEAALVDFRATSGAARSAARLGLAVEGAPDRRKFNVRRLDSFARWLLSFGGEAIPVAPPALVKEFKTQVARTREVYKDGE